jgi:hypothetical protein
MHQDAEAQARAEQMRAEEKAAELERQVASSSKQVVGKGSLHAGDRMSEGDDGLDAEVYRWKKQADKSERDCRELQAKLKDTESLSDILHGRLKMGLTTCAVFMLAC